MKFFGWGIYKKLRRFIHKIQLNPPVLDMNEHDVSPYWRTYEGGTTNKLDKELHREEILAFMVDEEILKKSVVLDLGCGFGRMNLFFDIKEYHGYDPTERMLENARKLNQGKSNALFHLGDGRSLRLFPDRFFDIVICSTVLLHLKARTVKGYAPEIFRVLKPDGFFIANFPRGRNLDVHKVFRQFEIEQLKDWINDEVFLFRKRAER